MPTKTLQLWIGIILFALLQACGGGGTRGNTVGSGAGADGGDGGTPTQPGVENAKSVQLLVSSPSVESSGLLTVDLTAVVLDVNRRAVPGKLVDLGLTDPNNTAFLTGLPNEAKTDENGIITAKLNIGTDHSNRTLTLTAKADDATAGNTVDVVGTELTLTGATSLVRGATTQLSATLKDSAGKPLIGVPLTITSALGNTVNPASANTNTNGQVIVTLTGNNPGSETITASAQGASATAPLTIGSSDFAFIAPTPVPDADVVVNTTQTLRVRWFENSVPQTGRVLNFTATRGTVTPGSVTVGASGEATVSISAASAGRSTVTASAQSGTPSIAHNLVFVTIEASNINVQADLTTLPVNALGQDTSRSTIRAVVRDRENNLVKNARVVFFLLQDSSAGVLATSSDITDVSGVATADYIAGNISSRQNGVQVAARVVDVGGVPVGSTIEAFVNLTVAGQSLFIRLGTDNLITKGDTRYIKKYTALVTDAAGNPKPGIAVQFELNPAQPPVPAYRKGRYVRIVESIVNGLASGRWEPKEAASCFNEDLNLNGISDPLVSEDTNYNGILDLGEDANGNGVINGRTPNGTDIGGSGVLTPSEDANNDGLFDRGTMRPDGGFPAIGGNPGEDANWNGVFEGAEELHRNGLADTNEDFNGDTSLTPGNIAGVVNNITTDSGGFAVTQIEYAPNYAFWTTMTLQAKVIVAGTESFQRATFVLPRLAIDFSDLSASPPGEVSPYGIRRNCAVQF